MLNPTPTTYAGTSWWIFAIAGIIAILFGIAAIAWPSITLGILILLFGVYVIVDGVLQLFAMFRAFGEHTPWWPHLLIGLIDIAAGIIILAYPGMTAVFLLYVIAFWAIFAGVVEVIGGLTLPSFGLVLIGLLSTVFGFVLLGNPAAGALALVVVIGIFAIIRGILLLVYSIRAPSTPPLPS